MMRQLLARLDKRFPAECLVLMCLFAAGTASASMAGETAARLTEVEPETVGMSSARLQVIEAIVAEGIDRDKMPGAVVPVARRGKIAYHRAFGHRQLVPTKEEMTTDTVFDLASLTKPVATATSIMLLAERGQVELDDPVTQYIPEFNRHGKQPITLLQLLTHQSGLIADNPLRDYADGADQAMRRICDLSPVAEPGTRFIYSDVGYIVLAEIVRRVSGKDIHQFSREHIFQPLGMQDTGFCPAAELRKRSATTEQREGQWMRGQVHDPRAYQLGGVAGHAGLFSTAADLALYGQMMLDRGAGDGVRVLDQKTVRRMTRPHPVPGGGLRALGWDVRTGYSSNRGDLFSDQAFGHGGFTGTVLWIDPGLELVVIFLSNRVHPDGQGSVNPLAGRIGTVAAAAIQDGKTECSGLADSYDQPVRTGIDVLKSLDFRPLQGRRLGLITNHTGVDSRGKSTATILHEAKETELVAIFSPEHGFRGRLDQSNIEDSRDPETGLPVFSLYGTTRRPTAESLQEIDTLVFDIQDIGTRFYTYISTMGYAMEEAARHGLRFVVLDRPNPINGCDVAGPVLDPDSESFVGYHPISLRHGMTVGELARMFNAERQMDLDLQVIPMTGWRRSCCYDATGLLWINPSPNMRSLTQALLYPGIGILETTNLSVGRGTDTPFEVIGAPWLDGQRLAAALNQASLPGVRFVPVRFTPTSSRFAGQPCGGINIMVTDRGLFCPVRTGLEIARQLRLLFPEQWKTDRLNALLKDRSTLQALLGGETVDEIQSRYRAELDHFRSRRKPFLLYDEGACTRCP
jgi:uncharacterized protein YbbC (DUF1343 family)